MPDIARSRVSDEGLDKTLAKAQFAAERGAKVTKQLLAFSRQQILNPEVVEIGTNGVTEKDILVYDEKQESGAMAFLLSRFELPEFPMPIGVFKSVQRPAYDQLVKEQLVASMPPLLSSFSEDALAAARDAAPELKRALLIERIPADWAARLSRLACAALDVDYRELDAAIIAAAHRAGYKVMTYTANDPHAVAQLAVWGVDVIITDAIDVIRP